MPNLYGLAGGVNRKLRELYGLSGGANRKLKELYGLSGGVNRKIFSGEYDIYNAGVIGSCGLSEMHGTNTNGVVQLLSTYARLDSYGLGQYSDPGLIATNPIDLSGYSKLSITFDFKRCSYSNDYAMALKIRGVFSQNTADISSVLADLHRSAAELSGLNNPITCDLDISAVGGSRYPDVTVGYTEIWIYRIWLHN